MANEKHLSKLNEGIEAWNRWRKDKPGITPDLSGADLSETHLLGANLRMANLKKVNLRHADLRKADLKWADLSNSDLWMADFSGATLVGACLDRATSISKATFTEVDFFSASLVDVSLRCQNLCGLDLSRACLRSADLRSAKLSGANLRESDLRGADLREADLSNSNLIWADISETDLRKADLSGATLKKTDLEFSTMIETKLTGTRITDCYVYGISAWGLNLNEVKEQANLCITHEDEAAITVDNLEVAQFMHLLINNQNIRDVIDTITSKVVLVLGSFEDEQKAVLGAIKKELNLRDFTPIIFDFDKPTNQDLTGTVETLARMARFIIADLTRPRSIPHELATIIPHLRTTAVCPIRLAGSLGYTMFDDYVKAYPWVLDVHEYHNGETLLSDLTAVIEPADIKSRELRTDL